MAIMTICGVWEQVSKLFHGLDVTFNSCLNIFSVEDSEMLCECNPSECEDSHSHDTSSNSDDTNEETSDSPRSLSCDGGFFYCWIFQPIIDFFG